MSRNVFWISATPLQLYSGSLKSKSGGMFLDRIDGHLEMPTSHLEMCILLLLLNLDLTERLTYSLVLQFSYIIDVCNACDDELVMRSKLLQMLERLEK